VSALTASESSAQYAAYATVPGSAPISGSTVWLSTAEEKALGLMPVSSALDGFVGIGSNFAFDYASSGTPPSGEFDFIGVVEHEFSEVMGRMSFLALSLVGAHSG
jgi:hypothetical protein